MSEYSELKQKFRKGVKWTTLVQGATQLIQFVVSIILARFIAPAQFGLVAMILVFTGFAEIILWSFQQAIIQKKNITQRDLSTLFWFFLFLGVTLCSLFFCSAELIARLYQNHELLLMTRVLSLVFLFSSASEIVIALQSKNLNFKTLTLIRLGGLFISPTISITLAVLGYQAWAIVWANVAISIYSFIALWITTSWRPSFQFCKNSFKMFFNFSIYVHTIG